MPETKKTKRQSFPKSFWTVVNGGTPAVLYCFLFLYLAAVGAGAWLALGGHRVRADVVAVVGVRPRRARLLPDDAVVAQWPHADARRAMQTGVSSVRSSQPPSLKMNLGLETR